MDKTDMRVGVLWNQAASRELLADSVTMLGLPRNVVAYKVRQTALNGMTITLRYSNGARECRMLRSTDDKSVVVVTPCILWRCSGSLPGPDGGQWAWRSSRYGWLLDLAIGAGAGGVALALYLLIARGAL